MTMVLPKYEPNFEALTSEQAVYLAQKMDLPDRDTLTGHDIYDIANDLHYDQADVVMTLATDASVTGIQVVEALVGKPIVRRQSPTARISRGPRRSVSVKRSDPRHIVYVSETNPKKETSASHARFALYQVGDTIDQFLAKGGTLGDVKWDAERGFIRLEGDA